MRKKHHAKKHHRRRHRVGALSMTATSPLVKLGSVAVGYLAGTQINQALNMLIPASMKTQPNTGKMVAGVSVALGAFLVFGKGKTSMVKTVAGGLLAGAGIKRATVVFAPNTTDTLGGYGDVPVIGMGAYNPNSSLTGRNFSRQIAGYGNVPVVGGYTPNSTLLGMGKIMAGMDKASCNGIGSSYMG